jgi:hypothetical protein
MAMPRIVYWPISTHIAAVGSGCGRRTMTSEMNDYLRRTEFATLSLSGLFFGIVAS